MSAHIVFIAVACIASAPCEPVETRVWDGDTAWFGSMKVRMIGYDAPEYGTRSRCSAESRLAAASREELSKRLSTAREVRIEPTGARSYDRILARVLVDGEDVGDILVRMGLATRDRHDQANWCR